MLILSGVTPPLIRGQALIWGGMTWLHGCDFPRPQSGFRGDADQHPTTRHAALASQTKSTSAGWVAPKHSPALTVLVPFWGGNGRHPRPPTHAPGPNAALQFVHEDPTQTGSQDLLEDHSPSLIFPMHCRQ